MSLTCLVNSHYGLIVYAIHALTDLFVHFEQRLGLTEGGST